MGRNFSDTEDQLEPVIELKLLDFLSAKCFSPV